MFLKISQYLDKGLPALFYAGIVLMAVFVIPVPTLGFTLPKLAVAAATAFVGLATVLKSREAIHASGFTESWLGRTLLIYTLVIVTSLFWSVAPVVSVVGASPRYDGVLAQMVFFSLCVATFFFSRTSEKRLIIVRSLVIANVFVTLYGILQMCGFDPLLPLWREEVFLGRIFSTIGQPNILGQFLLLTLPFVWTMAMRTQGRVRLGSICLLFLNGIALLGTASRSAAFGFAAMIICAALLERARFVNVHRRMTRIHGALLLLCIAVAATIGYQWFSHRFEGGFEPGRSIEARRIIARDTLTAIGERPQGYGMETMGLVSPRFIGKDIRSVESLQTEVDRAHSKPLDLLFTLGPAGLVAYYALFICLIFSLLRRRRAEGETGLSLSIALALIGYGVSLLFGFETIVPQAYFWIIAGLALAVIWEEKPWHHRTSTFAARAAVAMLSLVCMVTLVLSIRWIQARFTMNRAEIAFAQGDLGHAVREQIDALSQFPLDRELLVKALGVWLTARERIENETAQAVFDIAISQELQTLSVLTDEKDGYIFLLAAWFAALQGENESSHSYIAEALRSMPHSVQTYRIAMHVYDLLGEEVEKERMMKALQDLLPPGWQDPKTEAGRILWKENPWLQEFVPQEPSIQ